MTNTALKTRLKSKAIELGFELVGITGKELPLRNQQAFTSFLEAGWHGDMAWMEAKKNRRLTPQNLWPETSAIIMLAMNYGPEENPLPKLKQTSNGVISVYAGGKDYHDIVKKKLKALARWFVAETKAEVKVFVDTAPVMEKPLAQLAGLGWQGKHTNLVSRELGSWTFLGAIFTTHPLPPDEAEIDHCGNCQACLTICPTNAFPAPYKLDARKCISYLTIEHNGPIPTELRSKIGNRIYGCDDCLAICPWNKFARTASETRFLVREATETPSLKELLNLDDAAFRAKFAGTPIKRSGLNRFLRNCLIAAGNSNDASLLEHIEPHLKAEVAMVRSSAIWAYARLAKPENYQAKKAEGLKNEQDPVIIKEWQENTI